MSYVSYENFLRAVMPFAPGLPQSVAVDAVRNAAIEFCDESSWLQYTPDAVTGILGVAVYQLNCPNDTVIARVTDAWYNTFPIAPKSEEQLTALCGVDWRTISGSPRFYTVTDDPTQVVLVPKPDTTLASALTSLAVLRPSRDSLTIDSSIYEWWMEVIAAGAKARLLSTPQQSYTNMAAAAIYAGQFRDGINKAKIERNRGLTRAVLTMRPPRFV